MYADFCDSPTQISKLVVWLQGPHILNSNNVVLEFLEGGRMNPTDDYFHSILKKKWYIVKKNAFLKNKDIGWHSNLRSFNNKVFVIVIGIDLLANKSHHDTGLILIRKDRLQ